MKSVLSVERKDTQVFRYAVLISCLVHAVILTHLSYLNIEYFKRQPKNVEVKYFDLKMEPKKAVVPIEKRERVKEQINKGPEMLLGQETAEKPPFVKDLAKFFGPMEAQKKKPVEAAGQQVKRKISVPPLKTEKINNPTYLSYYQIVRAKIKERAYSNYAQLDSGEVYMTFVISADGNLKQVQLIDEKTSANQYLKDVSLKSVQESNPFPSFPDDLKYPELTFNVVISFEVEK